MHKCLHELYVRASAAAPSVGRVDKQAKSVNCSNMTILHIIKCSMEWSRSCGVPDAPVVFGCEISLWPSVSLKQRKTEEQLSVY